MRGLFLHGSLGHTQGTINHEPAMRQVKALSPIILPYTDPWWRDDLSMVKKNISSGEDVLLAEHSY